ncbi:glycoside hydrolase superfamily [Umbelopsis sp. AD052]|nr:glycoside hydrolase superfamily [Umbelopsis sp. AD052]
MLMRLALIASLLAAASALKDDCPSVHPNWTLEIPPNASNADILCAASKLWPTAAQVHEQENEMIGFTHFGVNTYTGLEIGTGDESPNIFQPDKLNTTQWAQTFKKAGFKRLILTTKHHDGFCLWPSRYTAHSVKSSSWRNGTGNVVKEFVNSVREAGLEVGLYLSPADIFQSKHADPVQYQNTSIVDPTDKPRFGSGSPNMTVSIPTLIKGDDRKPKKFYTFTLDDYNRYYMNQLYELLTEYGKISEVWFDGFNPLAGVSETLQRHDWATLSRELCPDCTLFSLIDSRWVGTEQGFARETEWNTIPLLGTGDQSLQYYQFAGNESEDASLPDGTLLPLGSDYNLTHANPQQLRWMPAETDVSIRPGWFNHQDEVPKNASTLNNIYYNSVGRNTVWLLNIPPNTHGLLNDTDVASVEEFASIRDATFKKNLASKAKVTSISPKGKKPASNALFDTDILDTYWHPNSLTGSVEASLGGKTTFNRVVLQENIKFGQRVQNFTVSAMANGKWTNIANGTTIGYKRILRIDSVTASSLRVIIGGSRNGFYLSTIGLYYEDEQAM